MLGERDLFVIFRKLLIKSIEDVDEAKFAFFSKMQWKRIKNEASSHTLIVCSSYLDFLRLKRFFDDNNESVAYISEYTEKSAA